MTRSAVQKSSVPIAVHAFKHAVGRSRWVVQIIAA